MYNIKYVGEHVEVYNRFTNEFIFSADIYEEAYDELKES